MAGTGVSTAIETKKIHDLFAWAQYPRIDNFGQYDPQKGPNGERYWKPDSNILTPPNTPVTSLYDGTVTNVRQTSWGQTVVTIKMDTPLNTLATHEFYEHLGNATVVKGQRVKAGDLIGHTSSNPTVPALGFGFYSGDVYGSGPEWQALQNDLKPGGANLLNPTGVLNTIASGSYPTAGTGEGYGGSGPCDTPVVGGLICFIQNNLATWALTVGFFLLGLVLIILGFVILIHPNPETLVKAGELAA